jgi:hypothetical protein
MPNDVYICANCRGRFRKAWSDAEAAAEFDATFPTTPLAECAVVCDTCYRKIMHWAKTPPGRALRLNIVAPADDKDDVSLH